MFDPERGDIFEGLPAGWRMGKNHFPLIGSIDASFNKPLIFQSAQYPGCLGSGQAGFFGNIALAFTTL